MLKVSSSFSSFLPHVRLALTLFPYNTVKRTLAKNKPLRIDEILAERSAVPAVASKPGTLKSTAADKSESAAKVSKYTKRKLDELVRRKRDVIGEPTGVTKDQGVTEAVMKSGTYDVWGDGE